MQQPYCVSYNDMWFAVVDLLSKNVSSDDIYDPQCSFTQEYSFVLFVSVAIHAWRQPWLCDCDMCSTCCKQSTAQSEILALKLHSCGGSLQTTSSDPNSYWPAGISHISPYLSSLVLTGWNLLYCERWAKLTQRALFTEHNLHLCDHLKTCILSNESHTPSRSRWKLT